MKKQLEQVKAFHELFGAPILETPQIPSAERWELRVKLIREELEELEDAFKANDLVAVADALTDIRYVLEGAYLETGMGGIGEELFDEVQRSNMSKACKSVEEAEATMNHYKDRDGTESYYKEVNGLYLVYRTSDNKVLKSVNYSPANLEGIIDGNIN